MSRITILMLFPLKEKCYIEKMKTSFRSVMKITFMELAFALPVRNIILVNEFLSERKFNDPNH